MKCSIKERTKKLTANGSAPSDFLVISIFNSKSARKLAKQSIMQCHFQQPIEIANRSNLPKGMLRDSSFACNT